MSALVPDWITYAAHVGLGSLGGWVIYAVRGLVAGFEDPIA